MGGVIAFCMLSPMLLILGAIGEIPPIKRWLNRMAQRMPMFWCD